MGRITAVCCLLCLLALPGCSTRIEESPVEIVESAAADSIVKSGGDPGDWLVKGSCVAQGPCHVDVYDRETGRLIARNRYVVKDSRATVNGTDKINTAVVDKSGP